MKNINAKDYVVFDAKDKIAGRLASEVAKRLLQGKKVAVINAEKAIISGDRHVIVKRYKIKMDIKSKLDPDHSPYWSRRPDLLFKRITRGMLPFSKSRGRSAFRNLLVFMGEPEIFKGSKLIEFESKNPKNLYTGYITLKELANNLGYDKV